MPNVWEGGCFHSSPGAPRSSWLHSGCGSPRDPCGFFNAQPFSAQGPGGAAGPKGDQVSDRWSGRLWAARCLQGWGASSSSLSSPSLSRRPPPPPRLTTLGSQPDPGPVGSWVQRGPPVAWVAPPGPSEWGVFPAGHLGSRSRLEKCLFSRQHLLSGGPRGKGGPQLWRI